MHGFDGEIERDGERAPVALFAEPLALNGDDLVRHGAIERLLKLLVLAEGFDHLRAAVDGHGAEIRDGHQGRGVHEIGCGTHDAVCSRG